MIAAAQNCGMLILVVPGFQYDITGALTHIPAYWKTLSSYALRIPLRLLGWAEHLTVPRKLHYRTGLQQ